MFIPTSPRHPERLRFRPIFLPSLWLLWRFAFPVYFFYSSCWIRAERSRIQPQCPSRQSSRTSLRKLERYRQRCQPRARAAAIQNSAGVYAPLRGADALPPRFARHLPIERGGSTHFLAAERVVAVQAYAHYTYIFDGNDKLFCPLAIGDVESQLDSDHFVRVHRSHIVKIDCVVGYRRSGDNELVEMSGNNHYSVPVSRSRIASLKSRVAALNGDDAASAPRRRHRFAVQQTAS